MSATAAQAACSRSAISNESECQPEPFPRQSPGVGSRHQPSAGVYWDLSVVTDARFSSVTGDIAHPNWVFQNGDWLRVFEVPVPVLKQLLRGTPMGVDRLTQILENLAREQPTRSIHLKTTERQSRSATSARSVPLTISNDYMQTSKSQRFFDRVVVGFSNGMKDHRAAYCDGTRCAEVKFHPTIVDKPVAVEISKQFMDDMIYNTLSI